MSTLILLFIVFTNVVVFQNCAGFKPVDLSPLGNSLNLASNGTISLAVKDDLGATSFPVRTNDNLIVNVEYELQVSGPATGTVFNWTLTSNPTGVCFLSGGMVSSGRFLRCTSAASLDLKIEVQDQLMNKLGEINLSKSARDLSSMAVDGQTLYGSQCLSCHGAISSSPVKNKTADEIGNAILTEPQMMSNNSIRLLSAVEIRAIAQALTVTLPPAPATPTPPATVTPKPTPPPTLPTPSPTPRPTVTPTPTPMNCALNGQTIGHSSSIVAYLSSSVAFNQSCAQQTRICNNGTLSGSYQFSSCVVMPAPTPTPVPGSPTAEMAPIPSNFNIETWIGTSPTNDVRDPYFFPDNVGAFRFICKPSHNRYDDPIVYPGQPGASHLHTFFGNTLTDANSTYQSLRTTGNGTCAGGPLNRSAYWFPSLRIDDGDGNMANDNVVMPDHAIVYYKMDPEEARTLPRGLRFIFGYDFANPSKSTAFHWKCLNPSTGVARQYNSLGAMVAAGDCPAGWQIEGVLSGPHCWDGRLDSPDHRSHLSATVNDPNTGRSYCPATHSQTVPTFTLGVFWTVGPNGFNEVKNMYLSSDHMAPNLPKGSTLHTDWFGAWDDSVMTEWITHAVGDFRNSSAGNFGNGRGMKDPFFEDKADQYNSLLDLANPRLVAPPSSTMQMMGH